MRKLPFDTIKSLLQDDFPMPLETPNETTSGLYSITSTDNKGGVVMHMPPREVTHWQFIPLEDLAKMGLTHPMIEMDYFHLCCQLAKIDGTMERLYRTTEQPTLWQFDFTPVGGETRHIEIEHDDLVPYRLGVLCS